MKVKKFNSTLLVKIDKDLKENASKVLAKKNLTLSDFIRESLEKIIKKEIKK